MWLFAHRLALALGHADVDAMMAGLTSRQLARWLAYQQLEPWGEWRADLRAGMVQALVYNRSRGRHERARGAKDFMPDFGPRKPQDWRAMKAKMKVWATAHNARIKPEQ